MRGKQLNKVYDYFLKVGLGYQNPERLKKAITAQPKIYDGERLHSTKLIIDSPNYEKTIEDVKESRLKMKNKMNNLNYEKLNALYDTFVPQKEFSTEQTYFSTPSTSNVSSESSKEISDLPTQKMPNESKLLKLLVEMDKAILPLRKNINVTLLVDSDSTDIQANLLKRNKILKNDIKRPQAQSIDFELKLQHQKEKMACDNSWKSKLTKLSDENVLQKTQVESVVQESENIKLEYQTLFNSIKATQAQHQREINELIENVNQKTFAYSDVRSQNQDLLMTISELKNKLKTIEKGKNVNTKFDKSETLGKLLCVTPLKTNTTVKAKKVSNSEVKVDSGVESSHSVKRPKSKDNKSKNRVLKNTNVKIPSTNDRKVSNNVSVGSNKRETMNSTVCQSSANVLKVKTVNVVNDGSNIICVSCNKDVFKLSHEKCGARYALFVDFKFIEKFIGTVSFENDHFAAITGYGDYNLEGEDLLTGSRDSNLYTISISELAVSSLVCLRSKVTSTKSWLWH
ncbi:hypothetical protein Tco_1085597 [Tanacetum coccineum]